MKTNTPNPETEPDLFADVLLDCYLDEGANACQRKLGISSSTVKTIMRRAGVPMRTQGQWKPITPATPTRKKRSFLTPEMRAALVAEYRVGLPGEAVRVAKKYGISGARVYQILKGVGPTVI